MQLTPLELLKLRDLISNQINLLKIEGDKTLTTEELKDETKELEKLRIKLDY